MRVPSPGELLRLGRFVAAVEGTALAAAAIMGGVHASRTNGRFIDSFLLFVFLIFLLLLAIGLLSGPGMFLSRPKFATLDTEGVGRWRQWLAVPRLGGDQEFFELLLYTGLGFLLLAIATGIGALLG
jgi:hypothetical protein